jgi:FtsZ-interacting cell division protein YlmF
MKDQEVMGEQRGAESLDREGQKPDQALTHTMQARISRRTNQVKVLLNEEELKQLDWIVERMGSDRSSVMRYLLSNVPCPNLNTGAQESFKNETREEEITRIRTGDIPGPWTQKIPRIRIFEPRKFDQIPAAIQALREGDAIVVNLTMMEPDQAQRAIDFIAGGTFYGDGHQERVGESIFLFAGSEYIVSPIEVLKVFNDSDLQALDASEEIAVKGVQAQADAAGVNNEAAIKPGSEEE